MFEFHIEYRNIKNSDLWKKLYDLYKKHNIKFIWVKSHSATEENNLCDVLAKYAARSSNLIEDVGYKKY